MAGLVVHVTGAGDTFHLHALFHQIFVDVEQTASGEYLVELVLQQLIHAGATGYDHGLDVEVVECIGHAMEQHAVLFKISS